MWRKMASGFISRLYSSDRKRGNSAASHCALMFLLALPLCAPASAVERITLLALSRDQAILQIDGVRRVLRKGQLSPEGVKLVEADTEKAMIEIDGRLEELKYGVV